MTLLQDFFSFAGWACKQDFISQSDKNLVWAIWRLCNSLRREKFELLDENILMRGRIAELEDLCEELTARLERLDMENNAVEHLQNGEKIILNGGI